MKTKEFNLSEKKRYGELSSYAIGNFYYYFEKDLKEFINRRVMDLEGEQAITADREVKRVLLKLKANLEKDAGKELI